MLNHSQNFIRYCVVGIINTAIDFCVFLALFYGLGWPLLLANATGFTGACANSYIMNKKWTFRDDGGANPRQIMIFAVVMLSGLLVSSAVVWGLAYYMPAWCAKIFAIGAGLVWNFLGMTFFVFNERQKPF